jgi:hypothetical protein
MSKPSFCDFKNITSGLNARFQKKVIAAQGIEFADSRDRSSYPSGRD